MRPANLKEAKDAQLEAYKLLHGIVPNAAVGITRIGDGYALRVNLVAPVSDELPEAVNGVPLEIVVVGLPRAS
jgi:hypothetical protein